MGFARELRPFKEYISRAAKNTMCISKMATSGARLFCGKISLQGKLTRRSLLIQQNLRLLDFTLAQRIVDFVLPRDIGMKHVGVVGVDAVFNSVLVKRFKNLLERLPAFHHSSGQIA